MRQLSLSFAVLALLFSGCQGNKEGSPEATKKKPAEVIIGEWVVDAETTKKGWGDKAEQYTRMAVDEMGMEIEFREDKTIVLTKNGRGSEAVYETKSNTDNSLVMEVAPKEKREGGKVITWTVNVLGPNKTSHSSSEAPEMVFIMTRKE